MKKIMSMLLILSMLLMGAAMAETLTMATNAAFPPYEYYDDETGEVTRHRRGDRPGHLRQAWL